MLATSVRPRAGAAAGRSYRRLTALLGLVVLTLTIAGVVSGPLPAAAGDGQWTTAGSLPGEAPVFSLAMDPVQSSTLLAATLGAGLVRSDDGKTWRDVGGENLPKRLWKVAIDPSKGPQGTAVILVGSAGRGVFRSDDGGATWKGGSQGLQGNALNVRAIALGRGMVVIATSDGVWRSGDGGVTWRSAGLSGMDVSAVAFAQYGTPGAQPPAPAVLVAGIDGVRTPGGRVVRSSDLGATWSVLKNGLPGDLVVAAVAAGPVAAGGIRPLYVAGSGGIFKSDDVGDTWAQQAGLPQQAFSAVVPSPIDPNIVYAASDGGGAVGAGASPGSIVGGVWRSTDRGGSWTKLDSGLSQHGVIALAVGRGNPAALAAIAYDPDAPAVQPYVMNDVGISPSGTPEAGLCPLPQPCPPGDPAPLPAVAGTQIVAVNPNACASPSPSASPTSPSPSSSVSASPAAAASPPASPPGSPSPSATPCAAPVPVRPSGPDVPLPLVAVVILVLAGALLARLFLARR
jgi:hypothetical protein